MAYENDAIALISEAPDRTRLSGLEAGLTSDGMPFGEIRDGIEALDGQPGMAVYNHPLRRPGLSQKSRATLRRSNGQQRD